MMACVYGTVAVVTGASHHFDLTVVEAASVTSLRSILEKMGLIQASYVDPAYFDTEEVWLDI